MEYLLAVAVLFYPPTKGIAEQSVPAGEVADSVGVNIHLGFAETWYARHFDQVLASLRALHVRHVRDGVAAPGAGPEPFTQRHRALAAAGIGADFVSAPDESETYLETYPARVGDMEFLEAPNEPDANGARHWAEPTLAYLRTLDTVASSTAYGGIPLIGPSLVDADWGQPNNSYAQLGKAGPLFRFGNLHNYPAGRNPGTAGWSTGGYGSIGYAVRTANKAWPGAPLITTETGYRTDLPAPQAVPEFVQARYLPRLVLEQYLHGIRRTYLYELADDQFSGGLFGLLHSDGTTKPAFRTLQALMAELSDSEPVGPEPAQPGQAAIDLLTGDPSVHHLLVERHPGAWTLFVWRELPCYDPDTQGAVAVAAVSVAIRLGPGLSATGATRITPDGARAMPVDLAAISVSDEVLAVRIERH